MENGQDSEYFTLAPNETFAGRIFRKLTNRTHTCYIRNGRSFFQFGSRFDKYFVLASEFIIKVRIQKFEIRIEIVTPNWNPKLIPWINALGRRKFPGESQPKGQLPFGHLFLWISKGILPEKEPDPWCATIHRQMVSHLNHRNSIHDTNE